MASFMTASAFDFSSTLALLMASPAARMASSSRRSAAEYSSTTVRVTTSSFSRPLASESARSSALRECCEPSTATKYFILFCLKLGLCLVLPSTSEG